MTASDNSNALAWKEIVANNTIIVVTKLFSFIMSLKFQINVFAKLHKLFGENVYFCKIIDSNMKL